MKKISVGKVLAFTALAGVGAFVAYDLIQLKRGYAKYQDDLNEEASDRIRSKKDSREERVKRTLDKNIECFEKAMEDYGAKIRNDLD